MELIVGTPAKYNHNVLAIITKHIIKEKIPKNKENLIGASVKGVSDISKKLKKIPKPKGCLVLPAFLALLS